MAQIHKRFGDNDVKALLEKYIKKEVERKYIEEILGIKKRRFFELLRSYKEDPDSFTVKYKRTKPTRRIDKETEEAILTELKIEKDLIDLDDNPIVDYNYSYIADRLESKHNKRAALPTIIDRAKKHGYYIEKKRKQHMIGKWSQIMQKNLSAMTVPTTNGAPILRRSGTLSPPLMTAADTFFTTTWWRLKLPGLIYALWRMWPLSTALLTPIILIAIPYSVLYREEILSGEIIIR